MKKILLIFSLQGEPYMNDRKYLSMPTSDNVFVMSPDSYIKLAAEILEMSYANVIKTRLKDHASYGHIELAAKRGKLTIPVLDYVNKTQDGLHRAMWAKQNGIKKIPVLIYR
jgi:hypothetical protein